MGTTKGATPAVGSSGEVGSVEPLTTSAITPFSWRRGDGPCLHPWLLLEQQPERPMLRNWQVFWTEPGGSTGVSPVTARTLDHAYQVVLELHPGARVSAIDMAFMDPTWMPSLMLDGLRDWEDDFTP